MPKAKLTLYIDKETNQLARKTARLSGKSISTLVKEYFIQKEKETQVKEIPASVAKWIGILATEKTYKELRNEHLDSRLKRYEGTG